MRSTYRLSALGLLIGISAAQAAPPAGDIVQRSLLAFYYGGSDTKIRARMDLIDRSGGRRTRVLTMLRRDESEGANQRLFIYFHEPSDVRGVSLLVWKYPAKDDDRWIYMPAMDLERRVSANDRQSSFVGSDFTYEDVSGRDLGDERHRLVGEGSAGGRACYQIESTPVGASSYARRVWWIDKQNYLPLKEEYYDRRGGLVRVFSADEVRSIATGSHTYPTVTKRTMKDVRTGRRTEVTFTDVKYDLGLRAADFTERSLRRPPAAWIR